MKADPYDIKTVFGFEKQLFAPLFQRPYVWKKKEQWEPLWKDVKGIAEEILKGNQHCRPHFLGAVVLDQIMVPIGKPDARSIIDGQQRLTTLQLLMEGIRDVCRDQDDLDLLRRRIEKLIENEDVSHPDDRFKVWPTNVDRPVYRAIIETPDPAAMRKKIAEVCPGKRSHLADAYEYFYKEVSEWIDLTSEGFVERTEALVNTIREKLKLVVIDMDDQDDAQMIFETLNARGTPLLPSDLVKNFLFRRAQNDQADVETLHQKYWEDFDNEDHFWRKEIGIGRLNRARIDVYLQHYLAFQKRDEVLMGELFQEYQDFSNQREDKDVEWHLSSFHRFSTYYKQFTEFPPESREGVFFDRLSSMQTTTVYPFLLGLFDAVDNTEERCGILLDLESFLVRRIVCRLTTQNYNHLFLELVSDLSKSGDYSRERVQAFLLKQTADSRRWPNDEEFETAWLNEPLYNGISRPRLRILLYALDESLHSKKTEGYYLKKGLTVEHILPQHWEAHWVLPPGGEETPDEYAERKRTRNQLLHTIGNLTLLTSSLNPLVSNGPFDRKKEAILEHSALNLNRVVFGHEDNWDEDRILARGKELFKVAQKIWACPAKEDTDE